MTEDSTCCAPDTPLRKVAQAMAESDCGALPVIEKGDGRRLLGVITDRDIVVRAVAERKPLNHVTAREAMGENQLRRVLVADGDRACVGVVSQPEGPCIGLPGRA